MIVNGKVKIKKLESKGVEFESNIETKEPTVPEPEIIPEPVIISVVETSQPPFGPVSLEEFIRYLKSARIPKFSFQGLNIEQR
jgi:hypothetical protein